VFTTSFRRFLTLTTALSVLVPAIPAFAQDATDSAAAPPGRVGEIASVTGSASFNGAGSNGQWVAATGNYPLTTGDSVFTQASSQAALAIDSSQITLSESTELQITGIDQNSVAATESQGEVFLAINYIQPGQSYVITTPRGTVTINQNGNYDIAAGDQNDPTVVTVLAGAATVTDPGATLQVQANQAGVLTGTDQTTAQLADAQHDPFITAMLAQNAPPPPSYAPPVVQQMTGVSQLGNYGSWDQSASYGAVWYPQVSADWTPYREGHWAYVAPWGYTWVDSEPWGFAPFHYGRWIDDGNRWGWCPAPAYSDGGYGGGYQPVYAPAVVGFFGAGLGGIGIGITIGALNSGNVGWVPLGPDEAYYPSYRASPEYIRNINRVNIRNINNINIHNTTIINNYNYTTLRNRRGATYVQAGQFAHGDAIGRYGRPADAKMLADARPMGPQGFRPQPGQGDKHGAFALPLPQVEHRAAPAPKLAAFAQRRQLPHAVISPERAQLQPTRTGFAEQKAPAGAGAPGFGHQAGQPPLPPTGQHPFGAPGAGQSALHPGATALPGAAHPGFGAMPGYHAPPPPPGGGAQHAVAPFAGQGGAAGFHPISPNHAPGAGVGAPAQPFHPQAGQPGAGFHPAPTPPAFHAPALHPQGQNQVAHPAQPHVYTPQTPAFHPPAAPAYHPPVQQYHPPAPAYHPPAQPAYHPPVQQFHPPAQPAYHPPVQQFHPQPAPQEFHPQPAPQEFHPQAEPPHPEKPQHPGG
jgi:hypothetical protein